jgi:hypothetical protein
MRPTSLLLVLPCAAVAALLSLTPAAGAARSRPGGKPLVALHTPKANASVVRVSVRWRTPVRIVRPRRVSFLSEEGHRLAWHLVTRGFRRNQLFDVSAGKVLQRVQIRRGAARARSGASVAPFSTKVGRPKRHDPGPLAADGRSPAPGSDPAPVPPVLGPVIPPPAPAPPSNGVTASPPAGPALPLAEPESGGSFLNSVGVNVHMSYYSTAYNDWQQVREKLVELGIRHVRDGACVGCTPQRQRLLALAAAGIGVDFTMRQPGSPDTLAALVDLLAGPMRPAVDAIEGPNEYDHSGDPTWAASLKTYQQQLYGLVSATPALAGIPVLGPSLVDSRSYALLGNLSDALDWGSIHPYAGGQMPETNLNWDAGLEATVAPLAPIAATEAGYHNALNATTGQAPTSEQAAAAYVPRLFLDMFRARVQRTYLYELMDERPDPDAMHPESDFGLLRSDFSEKPSFETLRSLIHLVTPGGSFQLSPLHVAVADDEADLRHMLLQTGPKTYALVLWRNVKVWDQAERQAISVADFGVHVELGSEVRSAQAQQLGEGHGTDLGADRDLDIAVAAMPVVLTLST